jgi:hypothetical protein
MIGQWFSNMYVIKKIGFEDVKSFLAAQGTSVTANIPNTIVINTLLPDEQHCLIRGTLSASLEEKNVNDLLEKYEMHRQRIVVYGKNCTDESAERKVKQLMSLGFSEVFLYVGGMFEWMLLQDIYGESEFPTTCKVLDILKYKPMRMLMG